jgi:hypothetical protein
MKKFIVTLTFACAVLATFAQNENKLTYRKSINLDLLGGGIVANLSFDMRLKKGVQDGLGFRAGIGGFSMNNLITTDAEGNRGVSNFSLVTIPIEVNYLIGKRRSALETGVGILNFYGNSNGVLTNQNTNNVLRFEAKGFDFGAVYLKLGYRFQPLKNGITFNFAYTPLINGAGFQHYFGLGLGFSFR